MKTKIIILTQPQAWNFTDQNTGAYRQGNSAFCFLPFEGALQSFSNLPSGLNINTMYEAEIGFKVGTDKNGKPESKLTIISVNPSGKPLNWESICK